MMATSAHGSERDIRVGLPLRLSGTCPKPPHAPLTDRARYLGPAVLTANVEKRVCCSTCVECTE
jgi:hypothetical protein